MKKQVKEEASAITMRDIEHAEEWDTTRKLYSQLCVMGTMQLLMLNRLIPRFTRHKLVMAHEQKMLITRTIKLLLDAKKLLERQDELYSTLGKKGMDDFCVMNDLLAREGYSMIRMMLNWQNATKAGTPTESLEADLNKLSTGHKRIFSKKLIDSFRLEEDKV